MKFKNHIKEMKANMLKKSLQKLTSKRYAVGAIAIVIGVISACAGNAVLIEPLYDKHEFNPGTRKLCLTTGPGRGSSDELYIGMVTSLHKTKRLSFFDGAVNELQLVKWCQEHDDGLHSWTFKCYWDGGINKGVGFSEYFNLGTLKRVLREEVVVSMS